METRRPDLSTRPSGEREKVLAEVQEMRREMAALRRLFDEFAGVFLNARFPFGKPTDRWARR